MLGDSAATRKSHRRHGRRARFSEEIVPYEIADADGARYRVSIPMKDLDEGTSLQALSRPAPGLLLESVDEGVCTAGNSSQRSDGAAAVCLMNETALRDHRRCARSRRSLAYAVAAGDPDFLGPAPDPRHSEGPCPQRHRPGRPRPSSKATKRLPTQCLYVLREMRFDLDKVNVNGGAPSLSAIPSDAPERSSPRRSSTNSAAAAEKYGLVTMCIGEGMGAGRRVRDLRLTIAPAHHAHPCRCARPHQRGSYPPRTVRDAP